MLWAAKACQPGAQACDLAHGLPWYFTVAVVAGWLVVMVAVFALLRYRLRAWLARRAEARAIRRRALDPSHSTDVDLY